ncbi:MAG: thiamine pyrophosphate-binding protein [Candidatus Odinarchaeota archaeon]
MVQMTGGEIIVNCLKKEGIKYVFGVPGDQMYPVLDAIYKDESIDFITFRHEQSAANAADAWARVTNQPGVCFGTVGPGAVNLASGVYPAFADSIPLIVLCAQNQVWNIYPTHGMTQDLDQLSLFKPITKWQGVISHWKRIPELVQWAFRVALSGRPGPVLLDLPSDIMFGRHEVDELAKPLSEPATYRPLQNPVASSELIEQAVDLILQAELPLIHVGGGALRSGASVEIKRLAEYLQCPVTSTVFARGVLPDDHPLFFIQAGYGALGAQGDADLVVAIGTKIGDLDNWGRPPFWKECELQKMIQIDVDPQMIGMNRPITLGLVGDAKATVAKLLDVIKTRTKARSTPPKIEEIRAAQDAWLNEYLELGQSDQVPLHPLRVIKEIRDFFPRDAISIVDGGNTGVWAHYLNRIYEPNTYLWPGDSGQLGVGIGYAIGSQLAWPSKKVFAIMGDGAFMFNVQDLETARRLKLPIVITVLNDRAYGMIKAGQDIAYDKRYIGVDFFDVRYDKLAEAMDCFGIRVTKPDEIRPALEEAAKAGVPAVLDILVDREINLKPPDFQTLATIWLEGCLD